RQASQGSSRPPPRQHQPTTKRKELALTGGTTSSPAFVGKVAHRVTSTSAGRHVSGDSERLLPGLPAATPFRLELLRTRGRIERDRDLGGERPRPVGLYDPELGGARDRVHEGEHDLLGPAEARSENGHDGARGPRLRLQL